MPQTRILAFSDLAWGTREKGSAGGRVGIGSFLRPIEETDPAIVIFAGDGAYDRCSRSRLDETELFLGLLREIAAGGRHCVVVEGNNDDTMGTYGRVRDAAKENPHIHEISGKAETVQGIRFLGVPTGKERRMARSAEGPVDIVVAHAPLADRIWLFDLPAACILTGHYGMMIARIAGKAYVALDCSPASYAAIDWEEGWRRIGYAAGSCRIELHPAEEGAATGCDPNELRDLTEGRGALSYRDEVEVLQRAKREVATLGREEVSRRLLGLGIKKTHIERYLGKRRARPSTPAARSRNGVR